MLCHSMDEPGRCYAKWKKSVTKNCNIPYLWNTHNRQIYRDGKRSFLDDSVVKNLLANGGATGDSDLLSESGRSPGGGNGNPLPHSCWDNLMDRGAWQATVGLQRVGLGLALTHTETKGCLGLRDLGWNEMKSNCTWMQGSFWGDENIPILIIVMVQSYDYTKNHWIVHFKWIVWPVNYTLIKLL